jgi:hypothetical protein
LPPQKEYLFGSNSSKSYYQYISKSPKKIQIPKELDNKSTSLNPSPKIVDFFI